VYGLLPVNTLKKVSVWLMIIHQVCYLEAQQQDVRAFVCGCGVRRCQRLQKNSENLLRMSCRF